ncbi:MAG TPA: ABC transporter permease [Acidimicrobiales bacterium]|jgi:ABC-2 type transport system permease protein|nr:ABC transporter permease [Acidimicrobiales bacterium]
MSGLGSSVRDSMTMLRRDLRHSLRFPMLAVSGVMLPVFFLLLFVGVLGHTLGAGLGGVASGGASGGVSGGASGGGRYVDYLVPGIMLMTAGAGAEATAINVCTDMNEGIIGRFRTMAISRTSILTGQVVGTLLRTLVSGVVVVGVAFGLGFRSSASPIAWLAVAALFALLTVAVSWLTVAFGLVAKTPAGANSLSLIVVMLPFVSSAFVPTSSMSPAVRWFAQNQPFTPIIQTLRGLLNGTPVGNNAIVACVWCAGIAAVGYLWARWQYDRHPVRPPR